MIKKGFTNAGIFFLTLTSYLPLPVLFGLSSLFYFPLYYIIGYRRAVVRENLTKSFPNKSKAEIIKIEKTFYKNFLDLFVETVKLSSISQANFLKRCKLNNPELVEHYLNSGKSIIACSGHFHNWEYMPSCLSLYFKKDLHVIYKPLSNKIFEKWFNRMRCRFGAKMVTMKQTLRTVISTRKDLTILCFASDQAPPRNEIQYSVNFLNQKTPVFLGMEKIAIQFDKPVIYTDVKRVKRGYYEAEFKLIADKPKEMEEFEITNRFFELLEHSINANPAYWLWSHRRWKHAD